MIKFLAMDVDGTLTDGKVYMGNDGEMFKSFDIKDGYGIKEILPRYNIIPIIITARNSQILINRCNELGITEIHQGVRNKIECLNNIMAKYSTEIEKYSLKDVAYVGDDILDMQCMLPIKNAGGLAACPIDAVKKVIECCNYVSSYKGGDGAIRDIIEHIIEQKDVKCETEKLSLQDRLEKAIEYLQNLQFEELESGKYIVNDDFYYLVQQYELVDNEVGLYESHKEYVDIQYIINGIEKLYITDIRGAQIKVPYDANKDVMFYDFSDNISGVILTTGSYVVLLPKDAHRVEKVAGKSGFIKKIVGKVRVNSCL